MDLATEDMDLATEAMVATFGRGMLRLSPALVTMEVSKCVQSILHNLTEF